MPYPVLLAVSHGTASEAGQSAVAGLVDAVATRLRGTDVRLAHVDVQQPDVEAALAAIDPSSPVVIVPLLLSAGYHVRVDLERAAAARPGVRIAPALGPDERLVEQLAARLSPFEPGAADAVVLAVAGSSDERANEDCRRTAQMLTDRLGRPVAIGFLAAAEPRLGPAVERASASADRVLVAEYLLAPGYFHDLAVRSAPGAHVARPLLDDDTPAASLVDLVVDRFRTAAQQR